MTPTKGRPERPVHLNQFALEEWDRVCDELDQMGTLSTADAGVIAIHCAAWARVVKAELELQAGGEIVPSEKKVPMYNLWLSVQKQAYAQYLTTSRELGLTPKARAAERKSPRDAEAKDDGESLIKL